MNTSRLRHRRAAVFLLLAGFAAVSARAQFAALLNTNARSAGNNTGTNLYNGDTGAANAISLNAPSYVVFDSVGNLYLSDTANNCIRKIDTSGNVSTVAGLRVSGGADTCNTLTNSTPSPAQGLLRPTGLAIDAANTLYISDSQHNCVRSLASGVIDTLAANALTTVAGSCTSVDTASVTPVPNGLAIDLSGNLYISIQDAAAALPVNQVLRHLAADLATTVCTMAGQPSANVPNACAGVTGAVSLASPAGLAFDVNGNLFLADTGNNCVREIVGLATLQIAVGQCSATAGTLNSPYGLAFSPQSSLYISEIGTAANVVVSFAPGAGTLTQIAGLPSGAPGPYSASLDGQSSLSAPLDAPLGLTTDATGNIYLADSLNNVVRQLSTGLSFAATSLGASSPAQTVSFQINQAVNLTATIGSDYSIVSTSCSGSLVASGSPLPPTVCQVSVSFTPTRPGARSSALLLKDSLSGNVFSVGLRGTGVGPLSLLTPGLASTTANSLRSPIAVAVDSAGSAYVLEQGNGTSTADVILIPAGGAATRVVVAQGTGLQTPTAMAVDGAGNIFIADAAYGGVIRFGADGSINTSYVTGIIDATALAVDGFDNLYIAQGDVAHNVIEVYASGTRRVIAGSGTVSGADGVPATSALFLAPSGLALGPNGLSIADASGHVVYTVDSTGTIHLVAGNGLTTTTAAGQATGTALLLPVGLAVDAAGDLYIADAAANRVYEVYPVSSSGVNISYPLGTGASGYAGDGGPAPGASLTTPMSIALDGSSDLFAVDFGNNALREVTYPVTSTLNFGHIVVGTTSKVLQQAIGNAGNAGLTLPAPFTTTDPQYAISSNATLTTCIGILVAGGVCDVGFTFTPTVIGSSPAQSNVPSNSYNSQQTVLLNAIGINSQALPYTLNTETEVYGQPFSETATLNIVYPNLVPTGTMAYSIAGETTCSIAGPFPVASTCAAAESGLSVGNYQVNFAYTSGDINYFSTTGTTTLVITPGTLAVSPANVTKVYGAPIPTLPSTLTGVVNGDLFLASQTTTATASSPVGSYPITSTLTPVGLASLSNYNVTYNPGTLTIVPIPLTVTVANATRVYGAANPVFSSTITGAINGDTFIVTYSTPANATSPVGAYPITATLSGPAAANYSITVVPGTLTITQATLTVTVGNATRMYGAANPVFTSTITGALNGDTFINTYSTTATLASPVGAYPITDVLGGPAAVNYLITVVPGTLTITQSTAALNITANDATRAYGAANPTFTSTITGALNGDTFTITYASAPVTAPVGTYPIVPTVSGAALSNYATVTTTNGTLSITVATLNVAVSNATRIYGAANPTFSSVVTGLANGDTVTVAYATTATPASPVGAYPVTATVSGAAAANYIVTTTPGTLTITTAPITVTVASVTRAYGAANPVFTSTTTGLVNGDTLTSTYSTSAILTSPVGAYPITDALSGAASANYSVTVVPGTLTISQAILTLNFTANNATRPYGTANPVFTGTVPGALNGDTFTVTYATVATPASAAGTYAIVPNVSGAALANYSTVTEANGTLTVAPTPLAVTVASATRVYGAADPVFTSTITGALNGDTFVNTYSTTATATSPAGTYPISDVLSGPAASNYTVTLVPGTLTILPAPIALAVLVNSATRLYGAANPTFTSTVTGAINGDTFLVTYATAAAVTSPVGAYPVTATVSGAALTNYMLTNNPGTLTIAPAPLSVSASSATRVYGAANPTFTSTITGVLNGDMVTIAYATAASANSPVGTYPVVPTASGSAASNYIATYMNGTLTITAATLPLTVSVNNATRVFGSVNPPFTSAITGLLNGDTVTITYATPATITTDSGTYPITATVSGAAAADYTLNVIPGAMAITPAGTSTALATSASPVLAGIAVTFTATVTSSAGIPGGAVTFLNGGVPLGTGTLDATGTAIFSTSALGAGSYAITAVYAGATDYSTSSGSLTQIVSPGSFSLAATPPSQFVRGPGTTVYTITLASVQNFAGPIALACAGLPADATCTFGSPTATLSAGGTISTTMTVVNTAADAKLRLPDLQKSRPGNGLAPITFAAIFPFEFTGVGVFLAGLRRRKRSANHSASTHSSRKNRLILALLCTVGLFSLAGCACFTSVYNNYTIIVTGTSTVSGVASQSASVILTVGQQ